MGNSTISKHASNYQKHKKLGQINLSIVVDQDQNNYQQMTIIRSLQSQNQFNLWYKELKKIDDTITRQVLLIPNKTVYESTGFCGSNGIVHLTYDYYPYVFQVEVDNRRNIGRYFLETELWYLLYNMARAGSKFEKYHKKIGDVHPSNILINDDGLIKLISTCSMPDEISNFDKLMQNPAAKVFLAPEELDQHSVQRAEYPKNIDPSLAECYSIGLCMLAAGTLQDIDSIYYFDQAEKKIQQHKISYYLKLFGEKYSSHLHSIVMGLLMDNPLQRKKCGEIYSSLYEHQDKILDLQTFFPYNSRIVPLSSQINNSAQNVQVYPVMSKDNRPLYQENQYHHPNTYTPQSNKIYSYPNGIMVNPIQSKYVPINMVQNQQMVGHQIPGNVYRQSGNVLFSGKR